MSNDPLTLILIALSTILLLDGCEPQHGYDAGCTQSSFIDA